MRPYASQPPAVNVRSFWPPLGVCLVCLPLLDSRLAVRQNPAQNHAEYAFRKGYISGAGKLYPADPGARTSRLVGVLLADVAYLDCYSRLFDVLPTTYKAVGDCQVLGNTHKTERF